MDIRHCVDFTALEGLLSEALLCSQVSRKIIHAIWLSYSGVGHELLSETKYLMVHGILKYCLETEGSWFGGSPLL